MKPAGTSRPESPTWKKSALAVSGVLLILSGLLHAGAMLLMDTTPAQWEGPLSIRKPILFGISTGLTLLSLAWIHQHLFPRRYDRIANPLLAIALVVEVGLITMQYWRGTASHFNQGAVFDRWIDTSITALIIFATVVIFDTTRRSFQPMRAANDMQLAIRSGLIFLCASCAIGFFMLFYGNYRATVGLDPGLYGAAGVMKFPHGITIHAIQYLPVFSWAMTWMAVNQHQRKAAMRYAVAAMTMCLFFSLVQTFTGRARFDLGIPGTVFLLLTVIMFVRTVYVLVRALVLSEVGRPSPSDSGSENAQP